MYWIFGYTAVSKKVVLQKFQTLNSKRARCDHGCPVGGFTGGGG
jgi:hypothetical protein